MPLRRIFSKKQISDQCTELNSTSKLFLDTKKSSVVMKNNPNLTERTANSSSHLKDEYNRLANDTHTKKGIEMYSARDLQKQINRSATPYVQEIYKKSLQQQNDLGMQTRYPKSKRLIKNQSIAGHISMPKKLSHIRSKSHSKN